MKDQLLNIITDQINIIRNLKKHIVLQEGKILTHEETSLKRKMSDDQKNIVFLDTIEHKTSVYNGFLFL